MKECKIRVSPLPATPEVEVGDGAASSTIPRRKTLYHRMKSEKKLGHAFEDFPRSEI